MSVTAVERSSSGLSDDAGPAPGAVAVRPPCVVRWCGESDSCGGTLGGVVQHTAERVATFTLVDVWTSLGTPRLHTGRR